MTIFTIKNNLFQNKFVRGALTVVFWLALWEILYLVVRQEILIVSPDRTFRRLLELAIQPEFWLNTFSSMGRILEGFFLAVIVGTGLAAVTTRFRFLYDLFFPVISIVKATPVASFIILALVWIKSGGVPVFISFLMVTPLVWSNVSEGIRKTDPKLLEMARCFSFSPFRVIRRIYLPSTAPYFTAACTTGMGLAWKAGIAAEVLANTKRSIGGQIYSAKIYIETADLFAWTIVVIIASVILEKLMVNTMAFVQKKYGLG